ncbi:WD domain-containing protein [Polychaeton citri CBS 116435]|uniref:WD domain-containing protein n=1 Tax=Polychaeton citri CBS 116435 TaxID=1314669 RepID=A0A9P4QBW2_9PEZI|nr:WD domain-containing protein [Polychaeton citri CBS 116435]
MSRSNDAGRFFQTSDALATSERKAAKSKNKFGNPINLPSKLLNVAADPTNGSAVLTAEAAGVISSVNLDSSKVTKIITSPDAPLTSVAVSSSGDSKSVFAGCWDKNVYSKPLASSSRAKTATLPTTNGGHTDFVKCLLATSLNGKPILISGGSDASIIVWKQSNDTFAPLHKLKGHTKSLQDLAVDPLSLPSGSTEPTESLVLFTASSDREIRRWYISLGKAYELPESLESPILVHETSVYKLHFDSDGDLWTASADKTAKHLVRTRDWEADTTLRHPDFVRDVVVHEGLGLVVTACRDEEIRIWNTASSDLVCTYSGHYEEVTGLLLVGEGSKSVVSVSIDGTVRRWGLERKEMQKYWDEVEREKAENDDGDGNQKQAGRSLLTAEEEAELAELMDDDDT